MTHDHETYLGDGLYIAFDGWEYKLRAPRTAGDDVVYLNPAVLKALLDYVRAAEARFPAEDRLDLGLSPGADDG